METAVLLVSSNFEKTSYHRWFINLLYVQDYCQYFYVLKTI